MIDFLNHNQARLFKNSDFCLNYIVFSISNFNLLNLKFLYNYIGKLFSLKLFSHFLLVRIQMNLWYTQFH